MKRTPYEMVREFHEVYDVEIGTEMTDELVDLRFGLMYEELNEVECEMFPVDVVVTDRGQLENDLPVDKKKLTKELADLMYVTIGTAITFGLPLESVFEAVHDSNLSKLGEDGKPVRRADGKVLKGPNYQPPNLDRYFED